MGSELIQLVKEHQPNIVLTDIKMPRMDGIEATKYLTHNFPSIKL
jgi:YesN/AraC family two-component response regulator